MISFDMKSFSFVLPEFIESEWREAIDSAEAFSRELLIKKAQTMSLVKEIKDNDVTPAKLVWINLWTKCISILDGVQSAYSGNSVFLLEVLERISTETFMHINTICEPLMKSGISHSRETVIDRLNAYAAWTLGEDIRYTKTISHKSSLDMVWDPNPARGIKYHPKKRAAYEALFGEIIIDTDPISLKAGRKRQEEDLRNCHKRLDAWLKHPDLARWKERIRILEHSSEPGKRRSVTFFELFNITEKSLGTKMNQIGLGIGYLRYKQSSMLIHGSTIEQMNLTFSDKIIPRTGYDKDEVELSADLVCSNCHRTVLYLKIMAKHLWP